MISTQLFFGEYCGIFKNSFLIEHLLWLLLSFFNQKKRSLDCTKFIAKSKAGLCRNIKFRAKQKILYQNRISYIYRRKYDALKQENLLSYMCQYHILKVQLCKLCNNKYMNMSTQITNTDIFTFMAALVFKLLSRKVLSLNRKRQQKLLKSRLLFKKLVNFTDKLLQYDKQLECKIFQISLTGISDNLSVLFQFP